MELAVDPSIADLFTSHGREMLRRARRVLRSEADAEDAVQEVMLALLRAPHVLLAVERIGAWLYTLVCRRCIDIIREDARRASRETEAEPEVGTDDLFRGEDPAELAEHEEVRRAVAQAVDELPDELRFSFVENALEMKTFREISEGTGISTGTLMARKKRAVDLVRESLRRRGFVG